MTSLMSGIWIRIGDGSVGGGGSVMLVMVVVVVVGEG